MARKVAEIDLGSDRKGFVGMEEATATHFGIDAIDAASTLVTRTRKSYTKTRYADLSDTTGKPVSVPASEWQDTPREGSKRGSGKSIIVFTKVGEKTRRATMNFPSIATNGVISNFLFTATDASKRPSEFINERGVRHPVLKAAAGDINPGHKKTDDSGDNSDGSGS